MELYRKGTILVIRNYPKSFYTKTLSVAIRKITGSRYNHVAVVVEHDDDLWVHEAVGKGFIRTMKLSKWLGREYTDLEYAAFNPPVPSMFDERLYNISGTPYDFSSLLLWQLLRHTVRKFFKRDKWYGRRGFHALKGIYCSEAIAYLFGKDNWWSWDPGNVYDGFIKYKVYESERVEK